MRAFGGIALAVLFWSSSAAARPVAGRRVGVGLGVGEPTAVTGYLSLAERFAADAALGVVSPDERDLAGHADLLVVLGGDATTRVAGTVYFGAGAFFIRFYDDLFAGARVPLGAALAIPAARLQLYAEVSLQLLVVQPYDTPRKTDTQAAIGIRFFP